MLSEWRRRLRRGVLIGALLAGSAAAGPAAAGVAAPAAPTFTVNSLGDAVAVAPLASGPCETVTGNHTCTLRAAIMKANHYAGGGATIILAAGIYVLAIARAGLDDETNGDLNLTQAATLLGAGAATTIIDGNQIDRVLSVGLHVTVTLSDLTLRNGLAPSNAGGILSNGNLTLNRVVVSGNRSPDGSSGGALVSLEGALTLNNSLVADNITGGSGGGIYNATDGVATVNNSVVSGNLTASGGYGAGIANSGRLTLNNSLVSGNQTTPQNGNPSAGFGGGIANFSGVLTMTNSTVSNNSAYAGGGGLWNAGVTNSYFSTIAGNLADSRATLAGTGGGIDNQGSVNLKGSLLGQNYTGSISNDGHGTISSLDYNLIETTTGLTLTGQTANNVTGSDPQIDSARDNGGPTPTRALLEGSPAIDAVPTNQCLDPFGAPLHVDQRGQPRPLSGACDIGAFEGSAPTFGYWRNLVLNGDAEGAAGSPSGAFVGVPIWLSKGTLLTTVPYNAPGGFPSVPTDTVPANHGDNFFAGGIGPGSGAQQVIDLSGLGVSIDEGAVTYEFSADLGGLASQGDYAVTEADFYDGTGPTLVGVEVLGPVTAADRGNQTSLLHRAASNPVPVGTRSVVVYVNMTRTAFTYNDAYADNIALVLLPRASLFLPLTRR